MQDWLCVVSFDTFPQCGEGRGLACVGVRVSVWRVVGRLRRAPLSFGSLVQAVKSGLLSTRLQATSKITRVRSKTAVACEPARGFPSELQVPWAKDWDCRSWTSSQSVRSSCTATNATMAPSNRAAVVVLSRFVVSPCILALKLCRWAASNRLGWERGTGTNSFVGCALADRLSVWDRP